MKSKDNIIIFGAGECGTSICAMLIKKDLNNIIAFSDNDKTKWGSCVLEKKSNISE
jgi:FlaA1/EpsC-like NDP-sugar epimerase